MVFRKQVNEEGNYIDKDGQRWEILYCERTESEQWVQTGTDTQIIDGETVEVPVMEQRVMINYGWDEFENIEQASLAYGLIFQPITEEEPDLTNEE